VAADYRLLSAVQDLHDLYQRLSPAGPYRLALFHDQESPAGLDAETLPASSAQAMLAAAPGIDLCVRAISCLLANHLAPASAPVCLELLRRIERLWQALNPGQRPPVYFGYLARELFAQRGEEGADPQLIEQRSTRAYRMFGEVLAIYLDLLCDARPSLAEQFTQRISALRAQIVAELPATG
jgi:hypothetical protein